jgi:hypothetical protein
MNDREAVDIVRQAAVGLEPTPDGLAPLLDTIADASLARIPNP